MRLNILVISIFLGLTTCRKDKSLDESPGESLGRDFIECMRAQNLDSTAISAKLIGSWALKKQSTYSNKFVDANKNIIATFNSDSTFSVIENSNVVTQGTWRLIYYSANHYSLQPNEYNPYIGGEVYFCDNQVLFFASPLDGINNLFEK